MTGNRTAVVASIADRLGFISSAVCLVHCIAGPVLLVSGAVLPAPLLTDELFHEVLFWAILPLALLAFGLGCWQHKDRRVLLLGVLGLAGLAISVSLLHDLLGESGERVVTVASGSVLMWAHLRNFRLCRSGDCGHD